MFIGSKHCGQALKKGARRCTDPRYDPIARGANHTHQVFWKSTSSLCRTLLLNSTIASASTGNNFPRTGTFWAASDMRLPLESPWKADVDCALMRKLDRGSDFLDTPLEPMLMLMLSVEMQTAPRDTQRRISR